MDPVFLAGLAPWRFKVPGVSKFFLRSCENRSAIVVILYRLGERRNEILRAASALDHLHGLLQAAAHAVEGGAEHRDLVFPALGEFLDLEVTRAHAVGGLRHA